MQHTRLMKNILLTTSICALLTTSVLAMEQEDTPQKDTSDNAPKKDKGKEEKMADGENQPHQNNQQQEQKPDPSVPMADGKNPFDYMPPEITMKILTHLDKKDVANMREVSKKNKEAIDSTRNSLFVQGYDEDNRVVKNLGKLHKAAEMGHLKAREILISNAEKSYQELSTQNDPAIKLSLCMNLAKDGLFLLLSEDEQKEFIMALYILAQKNILGARDAFFGLSKGMANMTGGVQEMFVRLLSGFAEKNIEGARDAFLNLRPYFLQMTEGGQATFIWRLYSLARDKIEGARDSFFGLSRDMGEMKEGVQREFIGALYALAEDDIAGARAVFFGLSKDMAKMKEDVREYYKKMLEEFKMLQELNKKK